MTKRMTKEELLAEKAERDATIQRLAAQISREDNQTDKLIDRGLLPWWDW